MEGMPARLSICLILFINRLIHLPLIHETKQKENLYFAIINLYLVKWESAIWKI